MTEKILVTSALPYVNNLPHMGTIIGCVLSADVFARFKRSQGHDVLYICGTDEHGTTTETKAIEEGVTPREICDKYFALHKEVYEWFGISFDMFGRTSAENHHKITQDIFKSLDEKGFVIEREVEQLYDPEKEKFLADRFVEGTCPHCEFEDARGDQCDNCGKLLTPNELKNPKSKLSGATPELRKSQHLYLDLEKLQPQLEDWFKTQSVEGRWTQNALTTTKAWFDRGLEPRAITRDLKWGVPVPKEGYEGKVFYVWFDAPIGYISITDQIQDENWKDWWQNKDVKLFQFMAKDNIPFHTILFPASLLGTGENWTMLHHISATEYLQTEEGKFSKSRGTGLFGDQAMKTGIPADVFRYYLLVNRPETSDTIFAWHDLQDKLNNELLANLGNLINRTLQFVKRYHEGTVTESVLDEKAINFLRWVQEQEQMITSDLEWAKEKDALRRIMTICQKSNQYFQEQQPWKTRTEDEENCKMSMFVLSNIIKDIAILTEPFMPSTSSAIFKQLGVENQDWNDLGELLIKGSIGEPEPLFSKLESDDLQRISGSNNKEPDLIPLQIRSGKIVDVKKHPEADKLFCETVDFGDEKRSIVSGLVGHYTEEELNGVTALFITNLKPAKLRGVESQGMILAAENKEGLEIVTVDGEPGMLILGRETEPEINIDQFAKHKLFVKNGEVFVDDITLKINNKPIKMKKVLDGKVR